MNIRPQDLTAEELALVDQLALREFDHAETIRTARACYEGCLAFIEARRAFSAPVEQPEPKVCPHCGDLTHTPHGFKFGDEEHFRCKRPEPKPKDGDSCWLGDSCPECNAPEPERKFPVGKCVICGAPYNAHAKYGGGYTCMDRPKVEPAPVAEGELSEAVRDAISCLLMPSRDCSEDTFVARRLEDWARSLPKAVPVPVEAVRRASRFLAQNGYDGDADTIDRWLAGLEGK